MKAIEGYFVNRYIKRCVLQGDHDRKTILLFGKIVSAWRDQFTEDNKPTHEICLKILLKEAIDTH